MDKLRGILLLGVLGAPLWSWLLFGVAFPVANEVVQRSKWTRGQSLLQGLSRAIAGTPLVSALLSVPVLGDLIRFSAGDRAARAEMPPAGIGRILASRRPPPPPAAALLPILLMLSCATPGGRAFTKCELGLLPQSAQTVIACAVGALTAPQDWQAQLEACGISLAPGQLNCIVASIIGAFGSRKAMADQDSSSGLISTRAQLWLNSHGGAPRACGGSLFAGVAAQR